VRGRKAIPPQELGGILNAHIGKSLERQRTQGVRLKVMPFDLAERKGTYPERLAKLQETVAHLPKEKFQLPEIATDKKSALSLFRRIRAGRHPLTQEGVVAHPPEGKPVRIKNIKEADVKITGVFTGKGRLEGKPAGFTYQTSGGGTGRVGTGFTEQLRADLPMYKGRWARIRHQGQFGKTGLYRAPALHSIHESKN
jgi:ATP-dependent DNA ligase